MFNFNNQTTSAGLMTELENFLVFWLGPRNEDYGESAETLSKIDLPEPLRRLYAFAGRWPSVTSRDEMCAEYGWVSIFSSQDMLLRPNRLQYSGDGKVVFICENQGVWSLATRTTGDEVPVWIDLAELGIEKCDQWPQAHDSLPRLLVTFCLRELTFGARFGVWDASLTRLFQSGKPKIRPLWLNGAYVYPDHKYNFYLMDDEILVGDFSNSTTESSYFFGANSESGIARLQASESPIVTIRISTPTNWTVEVHEDGSGEVGVFMVPDSKAEFPPGTFDFSVLRESLMSTDVETNDFRRTPIVYYMRLERGYANGNGVRDWDLVKQVLSKAITAAVNKQPRFDDCHRDIPFG